MSFSNETSRRAFLRDAAFASGAALTTGAAKASASSVAARPNVLMICADQFRADFIHANRENPSTRTPNLDALAERGVNFRQALCNQPLCSPSRSSFLTGMYATDTKVWRLGIEMDHTLPTVATEFKKSGYTTAFIGKWHVSFNGKKPGVTQPEIPETGMSNTDPRGWVPPGPSRGGFDDLWEGANVVEEVSHPYEGNYFDNEGKNIGFNGEYRVDFMADRAVQFLNRRHDKPWLLFLSQLEPHQQNDLNSFVPPHRYEKGYEDAFVPHDLRSLPGNWNSHLPGYYGCVQAIDDCVGKLVDTLEKTGQLANTIIVFFSDHGCTFQTRLGEYKRSPHESSLRVPFLVAGPGFERSAIIEEVVSLLDLTPTLLDGAGVAVPSSMKGKSLKPLVDDPAARKAWKSEVYVQLSAAICGRALRTKEWTYCAYDPSIPHGDAEFSKTYADFALYSLAADPSQLVNLVGREGYKEICARLRNQLKKRIVENGEPEPVITPVQVYA